jgi:phosphatidate cytidylyltransferase
LNRFSELYQRIISAVLGATFIVTALLLDEWSYFGVFLAITIFSQWEFYRLVRDQNYLPVRFFGVFLGAALFVLSFLIARGTIEPKYYFALFPLASLSFLIKLYRKKDTSPFINIALFYLGVSYIALPFALMNVMVFYHDTYSYQILLGLLIIIWASDTGAYFSGSIFGRTKLFARISPKKSWEGSIGGAVIAVVCSYFISRYFTDLNFIEWVVVSLIVVVTGTYGDLVESMFKRTMSIKDSGNVIPGHGGFLDRFDSLILSVPFVVVFLILF